MLIFIAGSQPLAVIKKSKPFIHRVRHIQQAYAILCPQNARAMAKEAIIRPHDLDTVDITPIRHRIVTV